MREYRDHLRPDPTGMPAWLGLSSITRLLIISNIAAFLALFAGGYLIHPFVSGAPDAPARFLRSVVETLGLVPERAIGDLRLWQLATHGFLHAPRAFADCAHLAFNMLALYFFGRELETRYGARRYLALYALAAPCAGLAYALADARGTAPLLGATASAFALMTAYAVHYPRQRVIFFFIVPLEIRHAVLLLIGANVALELGRGGGNAAHVAHLAGAAFGILFVRLVPRVEAWLARADGKVHPRPPSEHAEAIEARLDTLLEKISRDGMAALTRAERAFLERASRHYQRKP